MFGHSATSRTYNSTWACSLSLASPQCSQLTQVLEDTLHVYEDVREMSVVGHIDLRVRSGFEPIERTAVFGLVFFDNEDAFKLQSSHAVSLRPLWTFTLPGA